MITPPEPPVTGQTVLVTGGAGFIGSHIADALVDRNRVRILDDLSSGRRSAVPDGAEFIEGSIEDQSVVAEATADVDLMFHEAAVVSVDRSVANPLETNAVNLDATLHLLEQARRQNARVVLASSAAVYGDPDRVPVGESHPLRPNSPYGLSKLAADHYARLYTELYDVPAVALRYFNVYGPGQSAETYSGVISAFIDRTREGEPLTIHGDGTQQRDFVHVRDVVRANLAAATTREVGRAFNVGTGVSVSIRELAELIRDVTGSDSPIVHDDPRPGDIQVSRADITAARAALDYEPAIALRDGLSALVGESPEPDQPAR